MRFGSDGKGNGLLVSRMTLYTIRVNAENGHDGGSEKRAGIGNLQLNVPKLIGTIAARRVGLGEENRFDVRQRPMQGSVGMPDRDIFSNGQIG